MGRRGEIYTPSWIPCVFLVNKYFRCKWPPHGNRAPSLAALNSGADSSSQGAGPGLLRGAECGGSSDPGPPPRNSLWAHSTSSWGSWPRTARQESRTPGSGWGTYKCSAGRPAPRDPAWAAGQSRVSVRAEYRRRGKRQVARDRKGGVWMGRERQLLASGAEWKGGCLPLRAAHALLASAGPCGPVLRRWAQMGGRPAFLWVHDPRRTSVLRLRGGDGRGI